MKMNDLQLWQDNHSQMDTVCRPAKSLKSFITQEHKVKCTRHYCVIAFLVRKAECGEPHSDLRDLRPKGSREVRTVSHWAPGGQVVYSHYAQRSIKKVQLVGKVQNY